MRIQILKPIVNTGEMEPQIGSFSVYNQEGKLTIYHVSENYITILNHRYIHKNISHPMRSGDSRYYKRIHCLEFQNKRVYFLSLYGSENSKGYHIGLSWFENQRFLWKMSDHWLQQEKNIRYVINVIFLIIGAYIGFKNLK